MKFPQEFPQQLYQEFLNALFPRASLEAPPEDSRGVSLRFFPEFDLISPRILHTFPFHQFFHDFFLFLEFHCLCGDSSGVAPLVPAGVSLEVSWRSFSMSFIFFQIFSLSSARSFPGSSTLISPRESSKSLIVNSLYSSIQVFHQKFLQFPRNCTWRLPKISSLGSL